MIESDLVESSELNDNTRQYLTFKIGGDEYGVNILSVQEIHGWIEPRPMPDTPAFIKGVIDWRGAVVPIIDLRIRFNYESITYNKSTVIIILKSEIENMDKDYVLGIVVDAVSDVYDIACVNLKKAPNLGNKIDTQYVQGIAKISDNMIVVLKLNKLFNLDEVA